MAVQKLNVQYIRYYTDGTAARKLDYTVPQVKKEAVLPKPRQIKRKKVYVDPVAILGVIVAVCTLIVMAVGIAQLRAAREEAAAMEQYVTELTRENQRLTQEYTELVDLEAVEKTAIALGMVPSDQVPKTEILVSLPPVEEEPTIWESIGTLLTGLFA